jgi:hypothetical protein
MVTGDILRRLRSEGRSITRTRLYAWIEVGRVEEPPRDGSHRYVFSDHHLDQIRQHLDNPPRPGRPANAKQECEA